MRVVTGHTVRCRAYRTAYQERHGRITAAICCCTREEARMPDRMILNDESARLVLTTGDGTVLYDAALSYAAVAHSLDRGHGYEPEVIRFAYSAPTGAPEECEGHTDDDDALTSGKGIGEAVYCDGSCLPPAYVVRHARLIIEPLDGPDEEPPPRPQIYTDAAGVRHFRPSH